MNVETKLALFVGQPAHQTYYGCSDKIGHIAELKPLDGNIYSLGTGRMVREMWNVVIAWNDETFSEVSEGIAEPWLDRAARARIAPVSPDTAADMLAKAKAADIVRRQKTEREKNEYAEKVAAWRDLYRDKIPADAVAVLVAHYEVDQSDAMTDYFGTSTSRSVILAFSNTTRNNFKEMRNAAKNFAETAYLADAPADAEHRENWSMGAGYYLKATGRYSNGWKIRKETFWNSDRVNDRAQLLPYGEWSVPEVSVDQPKAKTAAAEPEKVATESASVGGFTISKHVHTKKGFTMSIVETEERVDATTFSLRLERAKSLGGWYSRKWGQTPGGFAFKDHAKAIRFAEGLTNA